MKQGTTSMGHSTTLTIRIDQNMKDRLETEAKRQKRSKSFLAVTALDEYLSVQEWQEQRIRDAMAAADRGELVSNEKVRAWVESLGTKNERSMPKA